MGVAASPSMTMRRSFSACLTTATREKVFHCWKTSLAISCPHPPHPPRERTGDRREGVPLLEDLVGDLLSFRVADAEDGVPLVEHEERDQRESHHDAARPGARSSREAMPDRGGGGESNNRYDDRGDAAHDGEHGDQHEASRSRTEQVDEVDSVDLYHGGADGERDDRAGGDKR